jgi:hypothetical protein
LQIVKQELRDMIKDICWDKAVKEAVWKKGRIKPDYSPNVLRWDDSGRTMMWSKFGRTDSRFGWTIEAQDPDDEEGLKNLDNLQPVCIYTHKEYL